MTRSPSTAALLAVLLTAAASAQTPGSCALGNAQGDLDVSDVAARVFNTGSLFFGNTTTDGSGYVVPRFGGHSPLFAAGLWVGGTVDGEVRVAGSRYSGFNFWPGPLNADGTLPDPADCSAFDRIYVVSVADVAAYDNGGTATADLRDWPVGLGAPAVTASGAPVAVTSREQTLDLAAGERPVVSGSQTAWWVMNDVGGPHTLQQSKPLGIEVRVTAYAIASTEPAGASQATVYRFEILNRSANTIEGAHASLFLDPDLGDAGDDYVGTDVPRGMYFIYNADDQDNGGVNGGYGDRPPALGFDLLSGTGASSYFQGVNNPAVGDPTTAKRIYFFQQGRWGDGMVMRTNRDGYNQPATFPVTTFAFPGDPVTEQFWSEVNNDNMGTNNGAGDRRGQVSSPAFALPPGGSHTLDLAILFAQGADRFDSITQLRGVSDRVQAAYDAGRLAQTSGDGFRVLDAPALIAPADTEDATRRDGVEFSWAPVDGASGYTLQFGPDPTALTNARVTQSTHIRIPALDLVSDVTTERVYWWVVPGGSGATGTPSDIRSVYAFRGSVLRLRDGSPAYVEVVAPGGGDPCASTAESTDGCDEVGGNAVYRSLNSTGAYYINRYFSNDNVIRTVSATDYEIRFTGAGGLATFEYSRPYSVVKVPFEIWDIGVTPPGHPNDPADDVRLLVFLRGHGSESCGFSLSFTLNGFGTLDGFVESSTIEGYESETSYDDYAQRYQASVDAAPEGCYSPQNEQEVFAGRGNMRLSRLTLGSKATSPAAPGVGTVIRLYSTDPQPVARDEAPERETLALTVAPNPSRGGAAVRYVLTAPATVRVALADVLGREVAVLAAGEQTAGPHEARVPGGLAAGVYVVTVTVAGQRSARVLTVVR